MLGGMGRRQTFRGVLERDGTSLGWTIVRLPFDPAEVWPQRNRLRVKGTINGFAFRTSLFHARAGPFVLLVNKKMQKGGRVVPGSVAEVVLEPDPEERVLAVPPELEALLRQDRALRRWHDALSHSYRKSIADRVSEPKSAASRLRRAEQMAECGGCPRNTANHSQGRERPHAAPSLQGARRSGAGAAFRTAPSIASVPEGGRAGARWEGSHPSPMSGQRGQLTLVPTLPM